MPKRTVQRFPGRGSVYITTVHPYADRPPHRVFNPSKGWAIHVSGEGRKGPIYAVLHQAKRDAEKLFDGIRGWKKHEDSAAYYAVTAEDLAEKQTKLRKPKPAAKQPAPRRPRVKPEPPPPPVDIIYFDLGATYEDGVDDQGPAGQR